MRKLSEKELAEIIQAYVWEIGNIHQEAGVIKYQLDHHWEEKKDYILQCLTRALNDDDERYHKLTEEEAYDLLTEDSYGWNGETYGVASAYVEGTPKKQNN